MCVSSHTCNMSRQIPRRWLPALYLYPMSWEQQKTWMAQLNFNGRRTKRIKRRLSPLTRHYLLLTTVQADSTFQYLSPRRHIKNNGYWADLGPSLNKNNCISGFEYAGRESAIAL